jgi:hypothetical protein
MSTPRRHHFVPLMLQRRFTSPQGKLYLYDKRRPEAGIYATNPVNAFVKKDLNAIENKDGTRDAGLEQWYAELEGEIAPIIDKIVESARRRQKPALTGDERNTWDNFAYHQQKRAPDVFERLGLVKDFRANYESHIEWFQKEVRPLTPEERRDLMSPETIERIIQHASVTARGKGSEEVIEVLAQRGIAIAVILQPNKSFIIGDHPLSRMGPGGELQQPTTELWLPIASDVAVSPWGQAGTEKLVGVTTDGIRRVNEEIFKHSNVVGACSEALLASLARIRKRRAPSKAPEAS